MTECIPQSPEARYPHCQEGPLKEQSGSKAQMIDEHGSTAGGRFYSGNIPVVSGVYSF